MGDITLPIGTGTTLGRPWSTRTFPSFPALTQIEDDINGATLSDEIKATLSSGFYNVKAEEYGALGDDATDDAAAIQSAIDAAEAAGGGVVYFPPGTYRVSVTVTVDDDNILLVGAGTGATTLKFTDDSDEADTMLLFTDSSLLDDCGIREMKLDGNKANVTTSAGLLKVFNPRRFRARDLWLTQSSGYGIWTDSGDADLVNTHALYNTYINIRTELNDGFGQLYQAEKNSQFTGLASTQDCQDATDGHAGVIFEGWGVSTSLRETTQCNVSDVRINDSGRFGMILDATTKFAITNIVITGSADSPIFLRNSNTTGAANSGVTNLNTLTNVVLRNNAQSFGYTGVETDANDTQVTEIVLANWTVNGSNAIASSPGVFDIRGWNNFTFANVFVTSCPGTVWHVYDGETTAGAATNASKGRFIGCAARNCGNASAATNHCFFIEDSATVNPTSDLEIDGGYFNNALTNGSSAWEIRIEGAVRRVSIIGAHIDAATNGGESNIDTAAKAHVIAKYCFLQGNSAFVPSVASAAALDPVIFAADNILDVTGTADITSMTAFAPGTVITLKFNDTAATTGVTDGSNLILAGNLGYTANDTLTLRCNGTNWYEIGRSVN